ncbi:aspartate aminotransferase family protein [Rhodospirillum rubrum]|uniref:Aminotransferase n=1 Tax=Rhodospirillum rubrum (strain ATCC 11170 / ATH 1.1.1 / DSM 467 / LMG 4362 / NCIMB 8255 / S1) TaxID=269796 RepID=Q2RSQ4_RHORT|nr:aspartate aminotransferase family protein [Rhodospirillum rubrum]ABC22841.1 aminotransferase [Rhodospirillum rubrum ATCC 11170]AEO48565.1 aminotransferase [Rhodospirillum rubrum F11]MBK5954448.1 aspartate aminotransferase family protein [Rhodospirillum rubrum]QXG78830.1 aspartate aminotransferase family protein [Rhodospirillum rubrum]HAP99894.1 aspartate aminotransferase family protein [Rhodospirillum rubrum]
MVSNALRDADLSYTIHPYTNLVAHETKGPLIAVRGEGVRVFDDKGKDYIEGMAGLWCASLGFSEPRLAAAAARQMAELPFFHMFSHKSHEPGIRLSEELVKRAPVPMARAFFCNSGSEANDTAIKMIWYINNALGRPQKKKIIARKRAYHGVTVASASLTGLPANHRDFDLPIANILHTSSPDYYREGKPGESEEAFAKRCADELEAMILAEDPNTVAAFFAEPIMGAGGVVLPPKGYFEHIQAVLKKYDILLVADEVICGFGRTGQYWGSQTFGLKPDILTCAKALSSAYMPISAVLVTEEVYKPLRDNSGKIGTFGHGYTYSAHPVAAAVALETLAIYDERDILGNVAVSGARLQERLRSFADHPLVGNVRGIGLIGAIELVADKATHGAFPASDAVGPRVVTKAEEAGVILRAMAGDVVAFSPPLIITPEEVDQMMDRFTVALEAVTAEVLG